MKLAEALVLRADMQKRVQQLSERLRLSALVQEGEQPPEEPQALLAELERLLGDLAALVRRINRTNLATSVGGSVSLTDALARRDVLDLHYGILKGLADVASNRIDRYSRTEIERVATVDVSALRPAGRCAGAAAARARHGHPGGQLGHRPGRIAKRGE